jgi:hypothetical protein
MTLGGAEGALMLDPWPKARRHEEAAVRLTLMTLGGAEGALMLDRLAETSPS